MERVQGLLRLITDPQDADSRGYAPVPPQLSGYHWYFGESVSGGVIPTNDGLACIVVSIPATRFADFRPGLAAGYERALDGMAPGLGEHMHAHGVGRLKAFPGARGRLRQAHGPGWMLVGDAGFFRDPLTSHGISDALRDAEGAAAAIVSGRESALRDFQQERDWPAVRAACRALLLDAERQVGELTGLAPISPPDMFVQMRAIPLPPCDAKAVKRRLWDEFAVEVPLVEWSGRQFVRVSIQCYNGPNDVDRLVEALKSALAR